MAQSLHESGWGRGKRMEVALAARCSPCVQPPNLAHGIADSGPTSERVGGESGVDDAGPPASDVTVDDSGRTSFARKGAAAQTA